MNLCSNLLLIACIFLASSSFAQQTKEKCICPENELGIMQDQFQKSYQFSNGKQLSIFGDTSGNYLSEFILVNCQSSKTIDYWGAVETCTVKKNGDTLIITELAFLPIGPGNKYEPTDWLMHLYYFSKDDVMHISAVNKNIKKYTAQEVKEVVNDFESHSGKYTSRVEILMDRLWLATISGDKTARGYFNNFEKKFGWLDGAYSEQYHDLKAKLELWDNNQIKSYR